MPSKKLLNGIPYNLTQQYFSTLSYYIDRYVSQWIWDTAMEKKCKVITIDILKETVLPKEMQVKPIIVYLYTLRATIKKILTSTGFDEDLITIAKFDIKLSENIGIDRHLICVATIIDKDGKIYIGKEHKEPAWYGVSTVVKATIQNTTPKVIKKLTLKDRIKNVFKFK
ncbi:MAG TPA: hypothetical protein VF411_03060 [Bacteroidia bacterium]